VESVLRCWSPKADGFSQLSEAQLTVRPEELLIDRAQLLGLSAPIIDSAWWEACGCLGAKCRRLNEGVHHRQARSAPTSS